jgi:hypothetical protein
MALPMLDPLVVALLTCEKNEFDQLTLAVNNNNSIETIARNLASLMTYLDYPKDLNDLTEAEVDNINLEIGLLKDHYEKLLSEPDRMCEFQNMFQQITEFRLFENPVAVAQMAIEEPEYYDFIKAIQTTGKSITELDEVTYTQIMDFAKTKIVTLESQKTLLPTVPSTCYGQMKGMTTGTQNLVLPVPAGGKKKREPKPKPYKKSR